MGLKKSNREYIKSNESKYYSAFLFSEFNEFNDIEQMGGVKLIWFLRGSIKAKALFNKIITSKPNACH